MEERVMRKQMYLPIMAFVTLAACACSKEMPEQVLPKGTPIIVNVGFPEEFAEADAPETRISFNGTYRKYKFDAGDSFRVFSYTGGTVFTDWGNFTTDAGGAWARFHGYVPENYNAEANGGTLMALYHPNDDNIAATWNAGNSRYEYKFNIPALQDGSGLKYCFFATPASGASAPVFTPGSETASGNPKLSIQFRCYVSLNKLNIVCGDVRTIIITLSYAKGANYNLVSSGDKKDIVYNCSNNGLSGGGAKTLTINNNDEVLSGDVFFVTRQTTGNANNGYAILTFEFINGDGKVCTKVMNLATGINADGTAAAYKNLSQYQTANTFGTVDLSSATFVDPE